MTHRYDRTRKMYQSGNIIYCSYWMQHELVIDFNDETDEVTVVKCDNGGFPIEGAKPRTHTTPPTDRDRLIGNIFTSVVTDSDKIVKEVLLKMSLKMSGKCN